MEKFYFNSLLDKCLLLALLLSMSTGLQAQTETEENEGHIREIISEGGNFREVLLKAEEYFEEKYQLTGQELEDYMAKSDDKDVKHFFRWYSFNAARIDKQGNYRDQRKLYKESNQRRKAMKNQAVSKASVNVSSVSWQNIGPNRYLTEEIGLGRTSAMAFHPTDPNTFYVGSGIGGVWKTTSGGDTYTPVGDDLPTLAVSRIVVDAENPSTLYVASGGRRNSRSLGVFKTTNDGATWQETALSFPVEENKQIFEMIPNPSDPSTLYVAVIEDGLYRTTDGFSTVERVYEGDVHDVIFKPGSSDILYVLDKAGKVLKSTNGGAAGSFEKIIDFSNTGDKLQLAVTPADPERIYFSHGNRVSKYTDEGATFLGQINLGSAVTGEGVTDIGSGPLFISPSKADRWYSGFVSHYRTDSDGEKFEIRLNKFLGDFNTKVHVDFMETYANPLKPGKLYFCNDGGVYEYDESANSFKDLNNDLLITQFYDIAVSNDDSRRVAGGSQDNGNVYRTNNFRWTPATISADGMVQAIDPSDPATHYYSTQNGNIYRATNGNSKSISSGINSISDDVDGSGNGVWRTPYILDPNDPHTVYAGYSKVYKSTNRGDSWEAISPQIAGFNGDFTDLTALAVAPSDSQYIYAIGAGAGYGACYFCPESLNTTGSINVTRDGGENWTTYNLPVELPSASITINPNDPETVYLGFSGYNDGEKVFKSVDGGENWTNMSGTLPNGPVNAIHIQQLGTQNNLFIGTDTGVYHFNDDVGDWVEYGSLPHSPVIDLEINEGTKTLYAATHGRSIFIAPTPDANCTGDFADDDGDGVCNSLDICPNGDDNLDENNNGVPDACDPYCSPEVSGTANEKITLVELLDSDDNVIFSNDSADQTVLYQDFTNAAIMQVEKGKSYTLKMTFNTLWAKNNGAVYLDFNSDGEWSEEEDLIGTFKGPESGSESNTTRSITFSVPNGAYYSMDKTILRIRMLYGGEAVPDPCLRNGGFAGETEDYAMKLKEYCEPEVSGTSNEKITQVDIKDAEGNIVFSNNTSGDSALYQNFSKYLTATLREGNTYTIDLSFNKIFAKDHGAVYLDYNKNLEFDPETELIGSFGGPESGSETAVERSITFSVPSNTVIDGSVLRIRMLYGGAEIPDPCARGEGFAGETEDYRINIEADEDRYCVPELSGTANEQITEVRLKNEAGEIIFTNNSEAATKTLYQDFTDNEFMQVTAGETYTLELDFNYLWAKSRGAVYLDFNADKNWGQENELLGTFAGISGGIENDATRSITFTVPFDASENETRMRIRMLYGGDEVPDPCLRNGGFAGETEDYAVKPKDYCLPELSGSPNEQITGVTITSESGNSIFSYNSTDPKSLYNDFSESQKIGLQAGETYVLKIDHNFLFKGNKGAVYLDYNSDKEFDLDTELLGSYTGPASGREDGASREITFTVPNDAILEKTRLRVRMLYGGQDVPEPCLRKSGFAGETEDYGVKPKDYCVPETSGSTPNEQITSVRLLDTEGNVLFKNNSEDEKSFYTDYSKELSIGMEPGASYDLSLGFNFLFAGNKGAVYIDYNGDKEYSEETELLGTFKGPASGREDGAERVVSFTVPEDAVIDPSLLRIRMLYAGEDVPDACGRNGGFSGETEDYAVKLKDYCEPEVVGTPNEQITGITLLDANGKELYIKNSTSPKGLYTDYSADNALEVFAGASYTLKLDFNYLFGGNKGAVYIDFDGNKDWFQEGEMIGSFSGTSGKEVDAEREIAFTVPEDADLGAVRLRIRMLYSGQDVPDPCYLNGGIAGETEDYSVSITPCPAISASLTSTRDKVYYGYDPEACTTISVDEVEGGYGTLSYEWSTGETGEHISVCPTETTTYTLTITDEIQCSSIQVSKTIEVLDVRCGNKNDKVMICHKGKSICISKNAIQSHLNHGDTFESCDEESNVNNRDQIFEGLDYMVSNNKLIINSQLNEEAKCTMYDLIGALVDSFPIRKGENISNYHREGIYVVIVELKGDNISFKIKI